LSDVPKSKEYIQGGTVLFHGASGRGIRVSPVEDHQQLRMACLSGKKLGQIKREFDYHLHKFGKTPESRTNCQLEIATP
jgi:hypothetical protein